MTPDRAELWAERFSRRNLTVAERSFLAAERRRHGLQILTVEVDTTLLLEACERAGFLSPTATPDKAEIEAIVRGLLKRWATLTTRGAGDPLAHANSSPSTRFGSHAMPTTPAPDLTRDIAALRRALGDVDRPARLAQVERRLRAARAAVTEAQAAVRARIAALHADRPRDTDPSLARLERELAEAERAVAPLTGERAELARQAAEALHRRVEGAQDRAAAVIGAALDQLEAAAQPLTAIAEQCAAYGESPPRLAALHAEITAYVRRARRALDDALVRHAEVRFTVDVSHGGESFAAGEIHKLPAEACQRWIRRGAAQDAALPYAPPRRATIRFVLSHELAQWDGSRRAYNPGDTADMPEALALQLIERGVAVPAEDESLWRRLTDGARALLAPPQPSSPPEPRGGRPLQ
jgi:hypothetical protein